MTSSIISNVAAYGAQSNIGAASVRASASISRLSSGNAINRASDDVAGLATGTSLRTQQKSLRTALANTTQGSSLLQVADGSLSQIVDILQRQKAIAVQAGSGSLTDTNRSLLNQEFQALTNEVNRIAATTSFNGVSLLSGGLGIAPTLVSTNALAASATYDTSAIGRSITVSSSTAVQAFDVVNGSSLAGTTNGRLQLTDAAGTALANGAYLNVSQAIYGQFSKFEFSNVNYGATGVGTATLTATINGTSFSGTVVSNALNAAATLSNGSTYIRMGLGAVSLTDAGAQQNSIANITNLFSRVTIQRTSTITGVDFDGTRLDGAVGHPTTGNASIRLASNGSAEVKNFRFVNTDPDAGQVRFAVDVNGKTFTAEISGTLDGLLFPFSRAQVNFFGENGSEVLSINIQGYTPTIDLLNNPSDRQAFIDALNIGFSRAGGGLNFGVGSGSSDTINVKYGSASTANIYGGQSLDVSSATAAAAASTVLDGAINQVISLRASVGALQSRFNFAGQSIQSSIESQDRARGVLLDTDVAKESTKFAAAQVQLQAGVAVLAQANLLPSNLLNLLEAGLLGGA